jgi:hypothetical protein
MVGLWGGAWLSCIGNQLGWSRYFNPSMIHIMNCRKNNMYGSLSQLHINIFDMMSYPDTGLLVLLCRESGNHYLEQR